MIDGFDVVDAHIHVQPWAMLRPEVAHQMKSPRKDLDRIDEVFRTQDAWSRCSTRKGSRRRSSSTTSRPR
jgi:hypothetical protein